MHCRLFAVFWAYVFLCGQSADPTPPPFSVENYTILYLKPSPSKFHLCSILLIQVNTWSDSRLIVHLQAKRVSSEYTANSRMGLANVTRWPSVKEKLTLEIRGFYKDCVDLDKSMWVDWYSTLTILVVWDLGGRPSILHTATIGE